MKEPRNLKLFIFLALLMTLFSAKGADGFKQPDFAYPKTAMADAGKLLADADKIADPQLAGITRLRALLIMTAADSRIDPDSLKAWPAKIDSVAQNEPNSTARGLMKLYEAVILKKIYQNRRYAYDRVDAPLYPLPADISAWNGEQFKSRIDELIIDCSRLTSNTKNPVSEYSAVIECDPLTSRYLPTIADAAAEISCKTVKYIGTENLCDTIIKSRLAASKTPSDSFFYWLAQKTLNENRNPVSELRKLYNSYSTYENARLLLYYYLEETESDIYNNYENEKTKDIARRRADISCIRKSLAAFPDWWGNATLTNRLNELTQPRVSISLPRVTAPGHSADMDLTYSFASSVGYRIYSIPAGETDLSVKNITTGMSLVDEVKLSATPTAIEHELKLQLTLPKIGRYAIVPMLNGKPESEGYADEIIASPFMPVVFGRCENTYIATVDYISGRPTSGVDISLVPYNKRRNKTIRLGRTDANGLLNYRTDKNSDRYGHYSFSYKGYNLGQAFYLPVSRFYENNDKEFLKADIFTDRPIYHQGDSIAVAVVVSRHKDKLHSVSANSDIIISLFDANWQKADSCIVRTDAFGRATCDFVIPKGRLTGYYNLTAATIGKPDSNIGNQQVMVSDFRLPTFEVEMTSTERNVPVEGAIRLKGRAITYSGMPVGGAKVEATINGAHRWRWFNPVQKLGEINTVTAPDGTFTIDVPADMLKEKNYRSDTPYSDFIASVNVTAVTAETASASKNFTTGKPYILDMEYMENNIDTSSPAVFTPLAYDADGRKIEIALTWKLLDKRNKTIASGNTISGKRTEADWNKIPGGNYTIELSTVDTALANSSRHGISLYNIADNSMPEDETLFLPVNNYKTDDNGRITATFGVAAEKAWVYTAFCTGEKIHYIKVNERKHGFHSFDVELPAGENSGRIHFVTYIDGKACSRDIIIIRPDKRAISIEAESFRDRLVPGSGETWRFRISDSEGNPLESAAMIATLYNHALSSLQSLLWPGSLATYTRNASLSVHPAAKGQQYCYFEFPVKGEKFRTLSAPSFLFSNDFGHRLMIRGRYYGASMKSAVTGSINDMAEMETAEDSDEAIPELAETITVAGNAESGESKEISIQDVMSDKERAQSADNFVYRDGETLQAFWRPRLVADADGIVNIVFNVPNANGAWMFNAFAWTPDLHSESSKATCVSSKPVMVQPNLPRFLRQGNKAVVPATVFNNSDDKTTVTTTVEIFDCATMAVLSTAVSTDTIEAKASAIVGINVNAPADVAAIGYRVRSAAGNFADGEQNIIPVLNSSATVIESTEFYLNPKENKDFELTISEKGNKSVTLQYCQNPIWNVVRAMRGIKGLNTDMSPAAASSLFSILASQRIIADNPAIEEVIAQWKKTPESEALTSMLSRNASLKSLMLEQTPWLQTAQEQSRRMEMLSQLFDSDAVAEGITANIASLKKAQNDDGGFRWGPWSRESSLWASETVLITLGIANSLNMLPEDNKELHEMIRSAVAYIDSTLSDSKLNTDTDRNLALVHALLPECKPTAGAKAIIDRTAAQIASGWKNDPTVGKAYDILILKAVGKSDVASDILASLRQFGVVRPGMGLCFPSVDDIRGYATIIQAFSVMGAETDELDAMRQWICVRSQATDDLGAFNPDYVIAATMLTGTCWTDVPASNHVTVDGKPIEIDSTDSASGYFTQAIDVKGKNATISVRPNGVTPSYGSVVTISTIPAADVKARPGKDVSIEKRYLVKDNDGNLRSTDNFTLGQKITVQLTIKVKRDLEYVAITDERAAALEPVEQLPGNIFENGLYFYRENGDAATNIFIGYLPRGTYHLSYDMTANNSGTFVSGIATLQSQYAPEITAHSAGSTLTVAGR